MPRTKHSVAYRARRKRSRDRRKFNARMARLANFGRRFNAETGRRDFPS